MIVIVASITKGGVLTTGLIVKLTIYEITNMPTPPLPPVEAVTAEVMIEVGNGMYMFEFDADINKKYLVYADFDSDAAGGLAATERYETAAIDPSFGYMVYL